MTPGEHVVRLGGFRIALAAEDEGWEVRDCIIVLGPVLSQKRTAWLLRWPLEEGTVAAQVLKTGTGALNIDGCRVRGVKPATTRGAGGQNGAYSPLAAQGRIEDDGKGRWPSNLVLVGEEVVAALNAQSGITTSGLARAGASRGFHGYGSQRYESTFPTDTYGDTGGTSRFFPCFKDDSELDAWLRRLTGQS